MTFLLISCVTSVAKNTQSSAAAARIRFFEIMEKNFQVLPHDKIFRCTIVLGYGEWTRNGAS